MAEHRFLVGLVGNGVGPSLTPALHMRAADRLGLPYIYRAVDLAEHGLDPSEIGEVLYLAEALGYDALNITHPCKTLVLPYLNELDERAAALQTVNTVLLKRGQRTGHNTDWTGFVRSFKAGLPGVDVGSVALVGAGGAGMSIGHALLFLGVRNLLIVDVLEEQAVTLAQRLQGLFPDARVAHGVRSSSPHRLPVSCTARPPGWPNTPVLPSMSGCCAPSTGWRTSSTGRCRPRF